MALLVYVQLSKLRLLFLFVGYPYPVPRLGLASLKIHWSGLTLLNLHLTPTGKVVPAGMQLGIVRYCAVRVVAGSDTTGYWVVSVSQQRS